MYCPGYNMFGAYLKWTFLLKHSSQWYFDWDSDPTAMLAEKRSTATVCENAALWFLIEPFLAFYFLVFGFLICIALFIWHHVVMINNTNSLNGWDPFFVFLLLLWRSCMLHSGKQQLFRDCYCSLTCSLVFSEGMPYIVVNSYFRHLSISHFLFFSLVDLSCSKR